VSRVLTMDLQCTASAGFFDIPCGSPLFAPVLINICENSSLEKRWSFAGSRRLKMASAYAEALAQILQSWPGTAQRDETEERT